MRASKAVLNLRITVFRVNRLLSRRTLPASLRCMNAPRHNNLDRSEVWQARVDLAACFRTAARLGLHEGVTNHRSFIVPGRDDLFLVNPDGWSFAEINASRLLICDFNRRVTAGDGVPEDTAFYIHARLRMRVPRVRAAFHTHMPNATSLTMVDRPPPLFAGLSSVKFYGRVAVDEEYGSLALDETAGDRITSTLGEADMMFIRHHWVMIVGPSIAKAWEDLYYLQRAEEVQRLAGASGRPVRPIPRDLAERTAEQMRHDGGRNPTALHLASLKRRLDVIAPEYKQ